MEKGKVTFGMIKYAKNMINNFLEKLKITDIAKMPAGDSLFDQGPQGGKLPTERAEAYYTIVAHGLFLCKRVRPYIEPTMAVLCTRVKDPNKAYYWGKLVRLMKYLNGIKKKKLT